MFEFAAVTVNDAPFVSPVEVIAPVCEILPAAVAVKFCPMLDVPNEMPPPDDRSVKFCPIVDAPNAKATESVKLTLFKPLLESETAPTKSLLAFVNVIAPALPVKLDAPVTEIGLVCGMPRTCCCLMCR